MALDPALIASRNSEGAQIGPATANAGVYGGSGGTVVTKEFDTSSAQDLVFSAQLANAADSITLESYTVEIRYAA